jgi:hypothetical protein
MGKRWLKKKDKEMREKSQGEVIFIKLNTLKNFLVLIFLSQKLIKFYTRLKSIN